MHERLDPIDRLLEDVTDGLLVVDHSWRITCSNARGATWIGWRAEDRCERVIWEAIRGVRVEVAMPEGMRPPWTLSP